MYWENIIYGAVYECADENKPFMRKTISSDNFFTMKEVPVLKIAKRELEWLGMEREATKEKVWGSEENKQIERELE